MAARKVAPFALAIKGINIVETIAQITTPIPTQFYSNRHDAPGSSLLGVPSAEEIFGARPFQPSSIETDSAEPSPAMDFAHRECLRLLRNYCFYDPVITESEILAYARRFGVSVRQAQAEIREERDESHS